MIDVSQQICQPVLKLDFTAHDIMESLSEFGPWTSKHLPMNQPKLTVDFLVQQCGESRLWINLGQQKKIPQPYYNIFIYCLYSLLIYNTYFKNGPRARLSRLPKTLYFRLWEVATDLTSNEQSMRNVVSSPMWHMLVLSDHSKTC